MRSLVLLRGAPGAGKSTFLKNLGLDKYTLSADTIRMLFSAPVMSSSSTKLTISQQNDNLVWELLMKLLEERMKNGEFTIIDATHSRSTDFSRYNELASKYRYRKYYVDFSNVDIDTCKQRNKNREEYKFVPDYIIEKMYSRLKTQGKTSGYKEIPKDNVIDFFKNEIYDFNKWNKVHIFGDIHGCYEPLKEYFDLVGGFKDDEFYLFTGDYLDRGLQNKEVLEFLINIKDKPNVLLLEGNHEIHFWNYANGDTIKSKEFIYNTQPQIEDINKKEIKKLYCRLGQMAYFTYDNKTYFVTHGGLPYIPDHLQFISTIQLIKGVGDYSIDIDSIFDDYYDETDVYQVHGHRNSYDIMPNEYKHSFNLEGKIERGGCLRVLRLEKGKFPTFELITNSIYRKPDDTKKKEESLDLENDMVEALRNRTDIREKELGNDISSFNYTRDAFYQRKWNQYTTRARGLFIDTKKKKIVARGYDKFFNVGENDDSKLETIKEKMKLEPAKLYVKYNGFLGLLSYYNNKLFFASKSTNAGEYAQLFKDIFYKVYNKEQINAITEYLKENDCTMTFEVISPTQDPHIIKYDKDNIILLDIIRNTINFEKLEYGILLDFGNKNNIEVKECIGYFTDFRGLVRFYNEHKDENNFNDDNIEGCVVEIGSYMAKIKYNYYDFWKRMRRIKDIVANKHTLKLSQLTNSTANYFYDFIKDIPLEEQEKDIIYLRDKFFKEYFKKIG